MEIEVSPDGFLNMLRHQNGGALVDELNRAQAEGVDAIMAHGGKAEVTLKLTFQRIKNMDTAVNISHDVMTKFPKEDRPTKAMFVTKGSGLSDQYQEQQSMDLGAPVDQKQPTLTPVAKIGDKQ